MRTSDGCAVLFFVLLSLAVFIFSVAAHQDDRVAEGLILGGASGALLALSISLWRKAVEGE